MLNGLLSPVINNKTNYGLTHLYIIIDNYTNYNRVILF